MTVQKPDLAMALVSISDAAKLVRKSKSTLTRDIENGYLTKTVLQDGDIRVDTRELQRAYGQLHDTDTKPKPAKRAPSTDRTKIALLEERIRGLERVIALEGELRRVKDQVTSELRARLADKEQLIKTLESKILFLEFDKQLQGIPTLDPADHPPAEQPHAQQQATGDKPSADDSRWWARLLHRTKRS